MMKRISFTLVTTAVLYLAVTASADERVSRMVEACSAGDTDTVRLLLDAGA